MNIKKIIHSVEHRPWKIPDRNWKFYQEWNNAVFLHWQVDYHELRKFVPDVLEIDTFEGNPWVSVVAFSMEKIRPHYLPYFPPISNFDEINIRTYIKSKHKTGVYFLSIEGGNKISCKIAKGMSGLPYRYSKMNRTQQIYTSKNSGFGDSLKIEYTCKEKVNATTHLDKWLTERYALFQDYKDVIHEFEIHHIEWPIQALEIKKLSIDYSRFGTLISEVPDKTHYSKGVQVIAWGKEILHP
ncbi:YqjF family protein [Aquimarina sp. 2304DJ70-9]|uniref:YqjF family protein n=1 Tax=Aquimarina penaris TaxID=3231044 RepID=UPI003461911D